MQETIPEKRMLVIQFQRSIFSQSNFHLVDRS